jgi:hypothetical protein
MGLGGDANRLPRSSHRWVSNRLVLGGLLSSRARRRFTGRGHGQPRHDSQHRKKIIKQQNARIKNCLNLGDHPPGGLIALIALLALFF